MDKDVTEFAETLSKHFLHGLQEVKRSIEGLEARIPPRVYHGNEEQFTPYCPALEAKDLPFTPRKSLADLQHEAHSTAKDKGWWDSPRGIPECLALIHSEVSEALEDFRNGDMLETMHYPDGDEASIHEAPIDLAKKGLKPCGFPSELADIVIRVMDLAGHLDISLQDMVELKMAYNATRPHRHGGKIA